MGVSIYTAHACTDVAVSFTLENGEVTHRRGRTTDFVTPMGSHFVTYNRGVSYTSCAPGTDMGGYYTNGEEGFSWENELGSLAINALGSQNLVDGINEAGFTGGVLTLNNTQFQTVSEGETKQALSARDFFKYLFGTCRTVNDAKEKLHAVKVWRCTLDNRAYVPMPLVHMSIHDNQGGNGVVEYRNGNLKFYEKTPGILTNDPIYPSQLDGLLNYSTFGPEYATKPMIVNGVEIPSYGDIGNRSVGMPGGTSPIDRFVATHLRVEQMDPPFDAVDATTRIWNLLYNIWAQPGSEIIPAGDHIKIRAYTRWALNINMGEGSISWVTDRNRFPQTVKIADFDLSPDAPQKRIPLGDDFEMNRWEKDFITYTEHLFGKPGTVAGSSSNS